MNRLAGRVHPTFSSFPSLKIIISGLMDPAVHSNQTPAQSRLSVPVTATRYLLLLLLLLIIIRLFARTLLAACSLDSAGSVGFTRLTLASSSLRHLHILLIAIIIIIIIIVAIIIIIGWAGFTSLGPSLLAPTFVLPQFTMLLLWMPKTQHALWGQNLVMRISSQVVLACTTCTSLVSFTNALAAGDEVGNQQQVVRACSEL